MSGPFRLRGRRNRGGVVIGTPRINADNRRSRRTVQPPTVTTTVQPAGSASTTQSFVTDISTNPFLRTFPTTFVGTSLRPQTPVFYFFDGVNVSQYVQRASALGIRGTNNGFIDVLGNSDQITYLTNTATILDATIDLATGNTVLFLANVIGDFPVGATITGTKSGAVAVIDRYDHRSGTANGGSAAVGVPPGGANSITFAADASGTSGWYVGNTVYIVSGSGVAQSGLIAQYNGITKVANVVTNWTTQPTGNSRYSIGSHVVERVGCIAGTFVIPNTPTLKFRAGERLFRIIDNADNNPERALTRAEFRFIGTGLTEVKTDITIQHPQQPAPPPPAPTQPAPTPRPVKRDPIAETFFVDESLYPSGVMITSVDLFFASKDTVLPVTLQVRPVVNGFPHSSEILKNGETELYPHQIKLSTLPNTANALTATTFTFPGPVYLAPGSEYAIVALTDSLNYNVYVSELGKQIIGSSRIVSTQPYLGSFFKSQNGSTWTPVQEEDLMFVIKKAVFNTGSSGTIDFYAAAPSYNINADSLYVQTYEEMYNNTSLSYSYSTNFGSSYTNITPKKTYDLTSRTVIGGATDGLFRVRGSMSTNDRNLSPIIQTQKLLVLGSENMINNLPITNDAITIVNGGTGYTTNANIAVLITGGGGTGANARVDQISGGAIQSIIVDSLGSGYTGQATAIIFGGTAGANANVIIASETSAEGGLARARYVTRVITLAEGFDAGDIRCYVTAAKPQTTEVYVYYKIRNLSDPEPFTAKPWSLMTQVTPTNQYSDDENDPIEYEYHASANSQSVTYTSGSTTYDSFNQFAIKIVLTSQTTTVIPVAFDMRAIALAPYGI
jgi:hypothetical protein